MDSQELEGEDVKTQAGVKAATREGHAHEEKIKAEYVEFKRVVWRRDRILQE